MNTISVNFFEYGVAVVLEENENSQDVILRFCCTNHSFLEVIDPGDFSILKSISVFHILNLRFIETTTLKIRLRNRKESFYIKAKSVTQAKFIVHNFENLINFVSSIPYSEFSLKNLIRLCLYSTRIANIENRYTLKDVLKLFRNLYIFFSSKDLKKLLGHCIENESEITNFEIHKIFKVIFLKEELTSVFKSILKISDGFKIKKKKISLVKFHQYLGLYGKTELSVETLRKFFGQITNNDILQPFSENIHEINFEQFSLFHFSDLNRADDIYKLKQSQINELRINQCFIAGSFDPAKKLYSIDDITSLEGVERAMEAGSRCINLSFSDGLNGLPIISTSANNPNPISAEICFLLLSDIAFRNSDMPLILILQCFCKKHQRAILSDLISKIFFGRLYKVPTSAFHLSSLPPIKLLRNKLVVYFPAHYPAYTTSDENNNFRVSIRENLDAMTTFYEEPFNELKLRTIYGTFKFEERKFKKVISSKENSLKMIELSQNNLICVTPDHNMTANPDPIEIMQMGVQICLLNYKMQDEHVFFQRHLFARNNRCGIIAKPRFLLAPNSLESVKVSLSIRVFSSQILNFFSGLSHEGIIYPFVNIKIVGHKSDIVHNKMYTSSIYQNNLFHSVYDGIECHFQLTHPDFSFIQFEVIDAKTEKIMRRGLVSPEFIRCGLKVVRLYDTDNNFDFFSYLLIYTEKHSLMKDY